MQADIMANDTIIWVRKARYDIFFISARKKGAT
jgi:hypothetical protein